MNTTDAKINRADVLAKIGEIIESRTNDPAHELRTLGKVLTEIADALDGFSRDEANSILRAVQILCDTSGTRRG